MSTSMDVLRPRQIVFEDISETILNPGLKAMLEQKPVLKCSLPSGTEDIMAKLATLGSTIREARGNLQQRLDVSMASVEDMLDTTGGRLAVETHVSGQKANWKFQGAKEAFMGELKIMRGVEELLGRDISSEISRTAKDIKALKVKTRDRNASICQAEQELLNGVQQLVDRFETAKKLAMQTAAKLPHFEAELREFIAGRHEAPADALEDIDEAELLRSLAEEEARAVQLEQQAASFAATWAAEDTSYMAMQEATRAALDEIRDLEEECNAAATKQGAQHEERLKKFETLASTLSRLTGVQLAQQGSTTLHVTITQTIPRAMPRREHLPGGEGAPQLNTPKPKTAAETGGVGAAVAEHVLILEFEVPASTQLRAATLNPPAVDIDEAVQAARAAQAAAGADTVCALSALVLDVKARIGKHCRRQLQLEDANSHYPLQPTSVSPELLRCVLPNKVEVEVLVPMAWPEETGLQLQLVEMQAPWVSQNLAPLLARLQQELQDAYAGTGAGGAHATMRRRQLRNCSLRDLLDWVYGSIVMEQVPT